MASNPSMSKRLPLHLFTNGPFKQTKIATQKYPTSLSHRKIATISNPSSLEQICPPSSAKAYSTSQDRRSCPRKIQNTNKNSHHQSTFAFSTRRATVSLTWWERKGDKTEEGERERLPPNNIDEGRGKG